MLGRGVGAAADVAGDVAHQLRPTARRLSRAHLTVGNLESTLSRAGAPTQGDDSFAADPRVAGALRDAGFDVLSLANNHVGDFGDPALVQTVRRVRAAGLETFGAGATAREARRPAVVTRGQTSFGFVGFNAIGDRGDGWVHLLPYRPEHYVALFSEAGLTGAADDPRYADLRACIANSDSLYRDVRRITPTRTTAEWLDYCRGAGIPSTAVARIQDLVDELLTLTKADRAGVGDGH